MLHELNLTQRFADGYDLLLVGTGLGLLLTAFGKPLLDRFNLNTTFVYLLLGLLAGPLLLDITPTDPLEAMPGLERIAELASSSA